MPVLKPDKYQATCKRSYIAAETVTVKPIMTGDTRIQQKHRNLILKSDCILGTTTVPDLSSLAEMLAECAHRRKTLPRRTAANTLWASNSPPSCSHIAHSPRSSLAPPEPGLMLSRPYPKLLLVSSLPHGKVSRGFSDPVYPAPSLSPANLSQHFLKKPASGPLCGLFPGPECSSPHIQLLPSPPSSIHSTRPFQECPCPDLSPLLPFPPCSPYTYKYFYYPTTHWES